jgi:tRNA dimethylallyltransferase
LKFRFRESVINPSSTPLITTDKTIISVVGPTAIGKTRLSIELAQHFNCPVLSCDSRQFYREMVIGTAAPSPAEQSQALHYFIHDRSISSELSVGSYEKEASQLIEKLFESHDVLVLVGGSGLYEQVVLKGLNEFPEVSEDIQEQLDQDLKSNGIAYLQNELQQVDPTFYSTADIDNPRRLLRALGIYRASGLKMSELQAKPIPKKPFKTIRIGLHAEREDLYERINRRVDEMFCQGLVDEVKSLSNYRDNRSLRTVGYQEIFPYLEGDYTLEEAIRLVKRNSRRYAKRQLTWYRNQEDIDWFNYKTRPTEIIERVEEKLKK